VGESLQCGKKKMKFHALLPVRDEADILAQCVASLLEWADKIYIFDTGSVDESWEIANELASKHREIILLGREDVYFSEMTVRAWMFNAARENFREGDWFVRADADEFHHIPPPIFVRERMGRSETVAYYQYYDFQFTSKELDRWKAGEETLRDRISPITQRRRFFTIKTYCEPRLCKFRESMKWPVSVSFPYNAGFIARERLPIRHYPHRDPVQMRQRYILRSVMLVYWPKSDWTAYVCDSAKEGLKEWVAGEPLPVPAFTNHLAAPIKRFAQRVLHGRVVRSMDSLRDGWASENPMQTIPPMQPIPPDKQLTLRRLLQSSAEGVNVRGESGSLAEATLTRGIE
jgi:hypothetical protein